MSIFDGISEACFVIYSSFWFCMDVLWRYVLVCGQAALASGCWKPSYLQVWFTGHISPADMFIILLETLVVFTCSSFYLKPWFSQVFAYVHNCSHVVTCASEVSGISGWSFVNRHLWALQRSGHRRRTTPRSREWRQNNSPAKRNRKTHGLANWELLTYLTCRVPAIRTGTLQFFGTMAGAFSDVPI